MSSTNDALERVKDVLEDTVELLAREDTVNDLRALVREVEAGRELRAQVDIFLPVADRLLDAFAKVTGQAHGFGPETDAEKWKEIWDYEEARGELEAVRKGVSDVG